MTEDSGPEVVARAVPDPESLRAALDTHNYLADEGLTTALYLAYTGSAISLFGIVVGIALVLSGIGFLILALGGAIEHLPFAKSEREQQPSTPASVT